MAYSTVNRGRLRNLIRAGKIEARRDRHYTDACAGEAANKDGKTAWKPAFMAEFGKPLSGEAITFTENDLQSKSGSAFNRDDPPGEIVLIIHSSCSYTLRHVV